MGGIDLPSASQTAKLATTAMQQFQYIVVAVQEGRATWVNGTWNGTADVHDPAALESCPDFDAFLNTLGRDGWELCTVDSVPPASGSGPWFTKAYLKRFVVQ